MTVFAMLTCAQLVTGVLWALLTLAGLRPFGHRTRLAVFCFIFVWVLNSLVGGMWNFATRHELRLVDCINVGVGLVCCIFYSHFAHTEFKRTKGNKR